MEIGFKLNEENIIQTLQTDYLNRNRYLNGLINILNNVEDGKIIALDGDWGSGKTWFLKSLEYLMTKNNEKYTDIDDNKLNKLKENYTVFYYNAWENDDATSPMLSLLYKLINDTYLQSKKKITKNAVNIFNNLVKFATYGRVDIKQLFLNEDWDNKQVTDSIKTSEEIKDDFKKAIQELLKVLSKNKMLIIIDEIDRCKPTFAIELLENIKHFYDDDRILFIVGTNNRQLSSLVQKVYGDKYDGSTYLDKFFDINLELPNNYMETYIDKILQNKDLNNKDYINYYKEIAKYYHLTMREYNRYVNSLNVLQKSIDNIKDVYGFSKFIPRSIKFLFLPLALCLKIIDKNKYYDFISGNLFEEILPLINTNKLFNKLPNYICKSKDENMFDDIFKMNITSEEKSQKIKEKSISVLKEIYEDLFVNCLSDRNKYDYKCNLTKVLDVISMMK